MSVAFRTERLGRTFWTRDQFKGWPRSFHTISNQPDWYHTVGNSVPDCGSTDRGLPHLNGQLRDILHFFSLPEQRPFQWPFAQRLTKSPNITCHLNRIPYQIDKVLVTDLPIGIVVCQSQKHFQFMGIQLRAMSLEEISKSLSADVSSVFRVKLIERKGGKRQRWSVY